MLELKKITKIYNTNNFEQKALDEVSITFRKSEFASILGASGSGKTTLLNIIGGLDSYTDGDLVINGTSTKLYGDRDWDTYRNNKVGFVFQNYNLITHQSILANVELALTLSGVSKKERREKAKNALKEVGLEDHMHKRPNQLSGGQMQRVAIARALVNDPDIILADEPTGALDSTTSVQIMELLKEVSKDRLVVMVTHNPELANIYSTRIINLKDGKVVDDSNPYTQNKNKKHSEDVSKRTSMSILTALSLSFNNLMTKKGRTILVSFAGSIGIIGIALILSLSTGFQGYIDDIQEDTLTSYPLTLTQETADMTSLMLSLTEKNNEPNKEGIIKEQQILTTMFSNIRTNDLNNFHNYFKENEKLFSQYVSAVENTYSVTPYIYSKDATKKIVKLNPSDILSSMYSSSMSTFTSSMVTMFNQIPSNQDKIEEQYEIIAGKWPEKYNELIIILPDKNSISDLLTYSLGLRDTKELEEIITNIMTGKELNISNEPLELTYDDLLNIELKLVHQTSLYKYNSKYNIYEDMSENEAFVKDVYNKAENLKIVGIVTSKEGVAAMSLNPGIGYKKELTEYIIKSAKETEIVKKQLLNEEIDVFSDKKFGEENKNDNLDFEDLISVDEKMLESAFNVKINQKDLENTTKKYMTNIQSSISADTAPAQKDFLTALRLFSLNILNNYMDTTDKVIPNPMTGDNMYLISQSDLETLVNDYFKQTDVQNTLKTLEKDYVIPSSIFEDTYKQLVKGFINGYIEAYYKNDSSFTQDENNKTALLLKPMIEPAINEFTSSTLIIATTQTMAQKMLEASMQKSILTNVGNLTTNIISKFANAFDVDPDKIAGAFKFDLSEEELQRIMKSMMSNEEASYTNNLIKLGYQDLNKPTTISYYFKSFEGKEEFTKLLDEYNDDMESKGLDDKVIKYTDITGLLMSSVKDVVNTVSYVLIAFVSISLVVSSIMIAIITYISVLERTKEIGILRAIGASKKDIARVFNAETFIEGLMSGLFGVGITILLCIPISAIIEHYINVPNIATLPNEGAIGLTILSVILTLLAGIIPSRMASKKDPVEALRSE